MTESWRKILKDEFEKPYFKTLETFVLEERRNHNVFPPKEDVFNAFHLTPFDNVKVVILGQDPYHGLGEAHGLAFSVRDGVKIPPSLNNIFKELESDLGIPKPKSGDLCHWAEQGVLLLNTSLTVRKDQANSHSGKGWEKFTDAVISAASAKKEFVVFVLWGANAGKKMALIDSSKHSVLQSAHPSPLSAHRGFLGSKVFSKINQLLSSRGETPIGWGKK